MTTSAMPQPGPDFAATSASTRVLVVDDDPVSCAVLEAQLGASGCSVTLAPNGREALEILNREPIRLVISDWYMPEIDGPELCSRIRQRPLQDYVYFIMVTSHGGREPFLAGMAAGADDFITKPVDPDALRSRVRVAERILGLHRTLRQLEALLPICSYCRRIRDDAEHWESLESFIEKRSHMQFSHGICADCAARLNDELDQSEMEGINGSR